jgi:hypothetical protein
MKPIPRVEGQPDPVGRDRLRGRRGGAETTAKAAKGSKGRGRGPMEGGQLEYGGRGGKTTDHSQPSS